MQASTYCTKQNVRRGIMAILLFAVLFSIPQVLFGFRNHRNHWTIYYDIDYIYFLGFVPLFMYLLPLSILIFVTLRLRSQLKSTSGQILTNQSLSQRRKRDRKITLSLIVIMTVFILCQVSTCIASLGYVIFTFVKAAYIEIVANIVWVLFVTRHALVVFNSSVNILIYVYFCKNYRDLVSKHVLIHFKCNRNQSIA